VEGENVYRRNDTRNARMRLTHLTNLAQEADMFLQTGKIYAMYLLNKE